MRLGDLDELKERISSYAGMFTDEGFMVALTAVLRGIEFQKTIDAVPVVRCKDCKWYHDFETHYDCANGYGIDYPKPDDFCSYGERKDGDGNT